MTNIEAMKLADETEVKEGSAESSVEVHITEARPMGWIAFYRYASTDYFSHVSQMPNLDLNRDYYRCPWPLFPTRENAIDAARYALRDRGGEVRIVKVIL